MAALYLCSLRVIGCVFFDGMQSRLTRVQIYPEKVVKAEKSVVKSVVKKFDS